MPAEQREGARGRPQPNPPKPPGYGQGVRTRNFYFVARVLVVGAVGMGGLYLLLYAQTGAWQLLALAGSVAAALGCAAVAYSLARRGRLDAVGYLGFAALLIAYGGAELLLQGITVQLAIGGALLLMVVGGVLLPGRNRPRLAAVGAFLFLVWAVNQFEPVTRYDVANTPLLSLSISAVTGFLVLVVLWRVLHTLSRTTIRMRLLIAFAAIAVIPLSISGAISVVVGAEVGRQRAIDKLVSVATLKEFEINTWLNNLQTDLNLALHNEFTLLRARLLLDTSDDTASYLQSARMYLRTQLSAVVEQAQRFESIYLLNSAGRVLVSTDLSQEGKIYAVHPYFRNAMQGQAYVHAPFHSPALGGLSVVSVLPVLREDGEVVGVLAGRASLDALSAIMLERAGLGETGETYLVSANRQMLTPSRFDLPDERIFVRSEGALRALDAHLDSEGLYEGYRGEPVVGVYRWLPQLETALLAEQDQAEALENITTIANVGVSVISLALAVVASLFVTRSIAAPLARLARTTEAIASGDLQIDIQAERVDEVGALAQSFNTMTAQLRTLIGGLEERVAERTRELETMAELSRAVTGFRDVDRLLPYAVDLIQERTGFYHVQVFLLDTEGEYAVLRASTGETGKLLLAANHRLAVGSDSVIGQVTARRRPIIALDTEDAQFVHRPNPILPDTRSEMALPLQIEGRVIGALDVQSAQPNAFDENDVRVFQMLADQLAVAIDNANLLRESRARLREIDLLNRRMVGETWREHLRQRYDRVLGAEAEGEVVVQQADLSGPMAEALRTQQPVVQPVDGAQVVALPVVYRGTTLGAVEFEVEGDAVDAEVLAMAQALVDRLALSLDNVRLTERAQRLAYRERVVNTISGKLTGVTDVADILQTAVRELGQALRVPETTIQLITVPGHESDSATPGRRLDGDDGRDGDAKQG